MQLHLKERHPLLFFSLFLQQALNKCTLGQVCKSCVSSSKLTLGCRLVSCRIVIGSGLGTACPTIVGPKTRDRLLMSILVSKLSATLKELIRFSTDQLMYNQRHMKYIYMKITPERLHRDLKRAYNAHVQLQNVNLVPAESCFASFTA